MGNMMMMMKALPATPSDRFKVTAAVQKLAVLEKAARKAGKAGKTLPSWHRLAPIMIVHLQLVVDL
jgi:hypothetical protein